MENVFKNIKRDPPFFGLHASRKVVSLRLCPQVPHLGRAYSAPQSVVWWSKCEEVEKGEEGEYEEECVDDEEFEPMPEFDPGGT